MYTIRYALMAVCRLAHQLEVSAGGEVYIFWYFSVYMLCFLIRMQRIVFYLGLFYKITKLIILFSKKITVYKMFIDVSYSCHCSVIHDNIENNYVIILL